MKHPKKLKNKALALRSKGYSLNEIAKRFKIAKSTASSWAKNFPVSVIGKKRLAVRKIVGKMNAQDFRTKRKQQLSQKYSGWASRVLKNIKLNKSHCQLYASLLYWTEGGKFTDNRIEFTNSDPQIVTAFMKLLRSGFDLEPTKIRANLHLYKYHDEQKQKKYWSKICGVPLRQFNKSFFKRRNPKTIKQDYPGCVRICYHSSDLTRKVKALYQAFPGLLP